MLHPESKQPHAVTFYVAGNERSVLLLCTTLLALQLIQTRPQLDYLPLQANLITSAADHYKENSPPSKDHSETKGTSTNEHCHEESRHQGTLCQCV